MLVFPRHETYTDSKVDFIGAIPSHWKVTRIANIFEEIHTVNKPEEELLSIDRYKGIIKQSETGRKTRASKDRSAYRLIEPGQLGYNILNAFMGSIGVSKYKGILSPAYAVAKTREEQNTWYYHYLFRTDLYKRQFNRFSYGIMLERNRLYYARFKTINTIVPPRGEQDKIVAYLRAQDAHIARFIKIKRALIDLLNEQKQTQIHQVVTKGINPNVKLIPSGIDWLGDVPDHWKIQRIKTVLRESDKRTANGREELLSLSRRHGLVPFSSINVRPPSAKDFTKYKICSTGQIIMNRMQAWSGMFAAANRVGLISPDYSVFSIIKGTSAKYLEYLFKTPMLIQQFALRSKGIGSGFNRLYTPDFGSISIALPSIEEQEKILDYLKLNLVDIDSALIRANDEIELILEYRERLITDAVTGQIDVRNWQPGPEDEVGDSDLTALTVDDELMEEEYEHENN